MATLKEFTTFVGAADDLKKAQFEAVMAVAKEKGFEEEAKAAIVKATVECAEKCGGVELSPEELKKVAGGTIFEASWWEYNLGCDSRWTIF